VDVSEDGSRVLVKERDGLVYLLDARFAPTWRGRMDRPVLRMDLAADGRSYVYGCFQQLSELYVADGWR
jgi:hypothetical protein